MSAERNHRQQLQNRGTANCPEALVQEFGRSTSTSVTSLPTKTSARAAEDAFSLMYAVADQLAYVAEIPHGGTLVKPGDPFGSIAGLVR
eukprot:642276-Prorocentrum_lima.AAC.1